jgi:hypothetical protein
MGKPIFPVPSRAMRVCGGLAVMVVNLKKAQGITGAVMEPVGVK